MILYFSGTGNSEHAAKRIGQETADEVLNLFERLKNKDYSRIASSRPWVVVTPTYAWRIPRILEEWLKRTELAGSRFKVYRTAPGKACTAAPGTILSAGKAGIEVSCGDGRSLLITELQAEGGKRMAAGAYLLGHPISI